MLAYEFELLIFGLTCVGLLLASYQDLKYRLVDGYIWLVFLILVIPVSFIRIILYWNDGTLVTFIIISMVLGMGIAFFMFLFGLWGGADIIALICLSLISPISLKVVSGLPSVFNSNYLELILPLSLTIVMNAALLQIPIPIIILIKNIFQYKSDTERYRLPDSSRLQKVFACCLGEPLELSEILTKPIFYYQVLEKNPLIGSMNDLHERYPVPFIRLSSEPLLRWQLFRAKSYSLLRTNRLLENKHNLLTTHPTIYNKPWSFDFSIGLQSEEEDLFRQRTILQRATQNDCFKRKYIWVQYSIPFLIPMFIGYILAFNGINILFIFLKMLKWIA